MDQEFTILESRVSVGSLGARKYYLSCGPDADPGNHWQIQLYGLRNAFEEWRKGFYGFFSRLHGKKSKHVRCWLPLVTIGDALIFFWWAGEGGLTLNLSWGPIFFRVRNLELALANRVVLWLSVLLCVLTFHCINPHASNIMLAYLLWVSVSCIHNYRIWKFNPQLR